ncbi:MAG: hypothetical protein ACYTBP_11605 [Planctomycetota bacterium]|jgi:hypothetical protein
MKVRRIVVITVLMMIFAGLLSAATSDKSREFQEQIDEQNRQKLEAGVIMPAQEDLILVKCEDPDCSVQYQISRREMYQYMRENVDPVKMQQPVLVCRKCGKESVYEVVKCCECEHVFYPNTVKGAYSDICPKCGCSEIKLRSTKPELLTAQERDKLRKLEERDRKQALKQVIDEAFAVSEMTWVMCMELDCQVKYQINTREMHWYIMEHVDPATMTAPALVCEKCGKKSVYEAVKCDKCKHIFYLGAVPWTYSDMCPKCKYSKRKDLRERAAALRRGSTRNNFQTLIGDGDFRSLMGLKGVEVRINPVKHTGENNYIDIVKLQRWVSSYLGENGVEVLKPGGRRTTPDGPLLLVTIRIANIAGRDTVGGCISVDLEDTVNAQRLGELKLRGIVWRKIELKTGRKYGIGDKIFEQVKDIIDNFIKDYHKANKAAPTRGDMITGTVRYLMFEGGFYGIVGDDGRKYDPVKLPEKFRKDGVRVRFRAREKKNVAGIHMWGKIVVIEKIEFAGN